MNGLAIHLEQRSILSWSWRPIPRRYGPTRVRGWNRLRLLSAGDSTFKYDPQ
jgi:hypothetical protein